MGSGSLYELGTGKRVRVCVWHMKLVLYETVALLIAMLITGHHTSIKVVRVGIFERWGNSILHIIPEHLLNDMKSTKELDNELSF